MIFFYNDLYKNFSYYIALSSSIVYFLCIVVAIFVLAQFFFVFLAKKFSKTSLFYKVLQACRNPFIMISMAFAAFSCIEAAYMNSHTLLFEIKNFNYYIFFKFAVYLSLLWFILNFIQLTEKELIRHQSKFSSFVEINFISTFSLISRIIIILIFGLNFLSMMGFELRTLLTFGGLSGALIGLAGKDLIANFLAILMVNFDRVFDVGDIISIPSLNIEGIVERIAWRLTVVRQFNKIPIYVPNSVFTSSTVQNLSKRSHRFFNEIILVKYSDIEILNQGVESIKSYLNDNVEIDSMNELVIVRILSIDGNFANLNVRCYIIRTAWEDYCRVATQLFAEIRSLLYTKHSIEIFKQDTVYQINMKGEVLKNEK